MNAIKNLRLHPDFPEKIWMVIEQPPKTELRYYYDPEQNSIKPKAKKKIASEEYNLTRYAELESERVPKASHS
jgi:hypothetical protein